MPSSYIGSGRSQAIYRLLFAAFHVLTAFVVIGLQLLVGVLVALGIWLIDWTMQLATGDGLGGNIKNNGMMWFYWPIKQFTWFAVSDPSSFPWLPTDV